ncbi:MAG: hypothetical protein PF572_03830 [Patescibacteria group bacterium]|jgi:type II secretory pathway component PulF|nr:hypothetical protein [Patescibacteria group bacterium]
MNQGEKLVLIDALEKTKLFPPRLKEFLILASEEGALDKEIEQELFQMLNKGK